MRKNLLILLSVLIGVSAALSPSAKAIGIEIHVGDRPYYQGSDFWDWGWHYVWVPGHMVHGHWVHGYYIRKGDWNRRHLHKRHNWNHHDHDHNH